MVAASSLDGQGAPILQQKFSKLSSSYGVEEARMEEDDFSSKQSVFFFLRMALF